MLRSPFPYFGGKSAVASLIWRRFGAVRNYVEPFFGSGAVLLQRPIPFGGMETVNDLDGMIANFWRAIQAEPDAVTQHADWPVSEPDLHARHLWLVNEGRQHVERLKTEPDYYDAKIAGWWCWGACQWIGSGWCEAQQLPHLGDAGMGERKRRDGYSPAIAEMPLIPTTKDLYDYFALLSNRLRRVRVCCGDWSRVCGPTPTVKQGLTAVFLDPLYAQDQRKSDLYAVESDVSAAVRLWCLENGSDSRLRIALCGYEGEGHEELEDHGWRVEEWKARGGYGSQGEKDGRTNCHRERIWFSSACCFEKTLFDAIKE